MTVAIAIACADGVVLASDSMGSVGEIATSVTKVHALKEQHLAWATSGTEFLTQAITGCLGGLDDRLVTPRAVSDVVSDTLRHAFDVPVLRPDMHESDRHKAECLFVGYSGGQPSIIHLPDDLAAVECRDKTFVAVGSGQRFAHVCKTLMDNYFSEPLTLDQARLVAFRIVSTVCSVSSWGVAPPVQMAWVNADSAHRATPEEMERLEIAVQGWAAVEASTFGGALPSQTGVPVMGDPEPLSSEADAS